MRRREEEQILWRGGSENGCHVNECYEDRVKRAVRGAKQLGLGGGVEERRGRKRDGAKRARETRETRGNEGKTRERKRVSKLRIKDPLFIAVKGTAYKRFLNLQRMVESKDGGLTIGGSMVSAAKGRRDGGKYQRR